MMKLDAWETERLLFYANIAFAIMNTKANNMKE